MVGKPEIEANPAPSTSEAFYTDNNCIHRWQGDIFATESFSDLPASMHGNIGCWMLMNRTCQLLEGEGRSIKIPKLVFCPVLPLGKILATGKGAPKIPNQISNIISGKTENFGFLPEGPCAKVGLDSEYVVDFGAVLTHQIAKCPAANEKLAQLSSPFAEHLMQRFARYYATIGYDDASLRDKEYQAKIAQKFG